MSRKETIERILSTIRRETRPISGHTDPAAIQDCWNEVFEQLDLAISEAREVNLGVASVFQYPTTGTSKKLFDALNYILQDKEKSLGYLGVFEEIVFGDQHPFGYLYQGKFLRPIEIEGKTFSEGDKPIPLYTAGAIDQAREEGRKEVSTVEPNNQYGVSITSPEGETKYYDLIAKPSRENEINSQSHVKFFINKPE